MTAEIALTLGIMGGALALFVWDRIRVDVVGVMVMAALMVTQLVTPQEGISGFANEATVTVAAMMILSAGLLRTGAVDILGRWIGRLAGRSELRLVTLILIVIVPISAFINNTAAVLILMPVVLGLAREKGVAPSRILMPLSFGSQLGGTLTLIGTSTNLLVAGLVLDLGLERIRLFEPTPPALILTALGVAYLLTVGRWLVPTRKGAPDLIDRFELREFFTGLVVTGDSGLVGQTLADLRFADSYGLQIVGIERGGERISFPRGRTVLRAGDLLLAQGKIQDIAQIEESGDLRIRGHIPELLAEQGEELEEGNGDDRLAEVIVPPRSPVLGRTLPELSFRTRYGVNVLAMQRHGGIVHEPLGEVRFEAGDIILIKGPAPALRELHKSGDLALLGTVDLRAKRTRKIKLALPIMILVVLLAALEVVTILVSSLLGVVAMFLTGCLKPDEAYEEVDWMVLVLLGSIIPLGIAMQNSGTAEFLALNLLDLAAPLGLYGILATFYLLTSLLTETISNNATAVVLTPVAVATGITLGVSPLPFVFAVMIAASNSFMTPIGYQTNTFIYGPGGYRFGDFFRVGAILNFMLVIAATLVIPIFFPF